MRALINQEVTDFQKYVTIRVAIEYGKIHKGEAGGKASVLDLAAIGCKHFNDDVPFTSDDAVEWHYYKHVLKQTLKDNNCPYLFYADATASGLQVAALLLEPKNKEVAEILNLSSSKVWYDTYSYIIDKFHSTYEIPADLKQYFSRKYLKKTMMIVNYNGTASTCYTHFVNSIGLPFAPLEAKRLYTHHNAFYKYVDEVFKGDLFFKNKALSFIQILGPSAREHFYE
jgi:hypothetical protein